MTVINVLDWGYVRLIDHMGTDLSIVRAARVSYNASWRTGVDKGSDHRLIHYLYNNRHMTPFEMVEFVFEVKAPLFIFRQWHRHRTWSYNEMSGRYTVLPEEFYIPETLNIGSQSKTNKQARIFTNANLYTKVGRHLLKTYCWTSGKVYKLLLWFGFPRELARCVLPLNVYSVMFAKVDLRNLLAFLSLRDDAHAQYEMQLYAKALKKIAKEFVPVTMEAFDAKGK